MNLTQPASGCEPFLLFRVLTRKFALPVSGIRRIVRAVNITDVPGAPATMLGVINVHGEVVPVVNFRKKFGMPRKKVTPDSVIILLSTPGLDLAFVADEVLELTEPSGLQECPAELVVPGQEHEIPGILLCDNDLIMIYDLEEVFHTDAVTLLDLYKMKRKEHHG
jgi:purine-binding chemotaxis protein CheW